MFNMQKHHFTETEWCPPKIIHIHFNQLVTSSKSQMARLEKCPHPYCPPVTVVNLARECNPINKNISYINVNLPQPSINKIHRVNTH